MNINPLKRRNHEAEEHALFMSLLESPTRPAFIGMARYCESMGYAGEAGDFYLGIVPDTFKQKYAIEEAQLIRPGQAVARERLVEYMPETYKLAAPLNQDKNRNKVFELTSITSKHTFFDSFRDADYETDGSETLLLDKQGNPVHCYSSRNRCLLRTNPGYQNTQVHKLAGVTVSLVTRNGHNFYHWMMDVLCKLDLLEAAGIRIEEVDHFIVSGLNYAFQKKTLEMMGIAKSQLIDLQYSLHRFHCENILMPHIPNTMGRTMSIRVTGFLRRKLLPLSSRTSPVGKKIAIHREKRGVKNRDEVKAVLLKHGFDVVQSENHSFEDQISIFANASHVVSPHGAGLANLVFCKPGTKVFEFYGEQIQPPFWIIAELQRLKYWNINCGSMLEHGEADNNKDLEKRLNAEMHVDVDYLENWIVQNCD
ncbi:MAG: glycosyltransferase family 61 protein [Gammaproteobacteria bacterium]|nr:glycosyltransferase family 61 protein [Gammaproteobacteria bacterium]